LDQTYSSMKFEKHEKTKNRETQQKKLMLMAIDT
jgi:hypothetical protein